MSAHTSTKWKCDMCLTVYVTKEDTRPEEMMLVQPFEMDGITEHPLLHMCRECVTTMQTNAAVEEMQP